LVEVITRFVPSEATATNTPLPYATETQVFAAAALRAVQVSPLVEVITRFVPSEATATNTPLPYATEDQTFAAAALRAVQVSPTAADAGGATATESPSSNVNAANENPKARRRVQDNRLTLNIADLLLIINASCVGDGIFKISQDFRTSHLLHGLMGLGW
jgi:hypothetical protein